MSYWRLSNMLSIVITGVTSGVGKALCDALVQRGERVIGIARNQEKLDRLSAHFEDARGAFHPYQADFSSFAQVTQAINAIRADFPDGIDALINNAAIVPKEKTFTEDGFEMQYQVNHLMVLHVSHGLEDLLIKRGGTLITTASNAHKKAVFDPENLDATKKYHALRSYARTKLYNLMIMNVLKQRFAGDIDVFAVHPGLVRTQIGTKDTSKVYAFLWRLFTRRGISPQAATATYLYLLYDSSVPGDTLYFFNERSESPLDIVYDQAKCDHLYEVSVQAIPRK